MPADKLQSPIVIIGSVLGAALVLVTAWKTLDSGNDNKDDIRLMQQELKSLTLDLKKQEVQAAEFRGATTSTLSTHGATLNRLEIFMSTWELANNDRNKKEGYACP